MLFIYFKTKQCSASPAQGDWMGYYASQSGDFYLITKDESPFVWDEDPDHPFNTTPEPTTTTTQSATKTTVTPKTTSTTPTTTTTKSTTSGATTPIIGKFVVMTLLALAFI